MLQLTIRMENSEKVTFFSEKYAFDNGFIKLTNAYFENEKDNKQEEVFISTSKIQSIIINKIN